MVKRSTFFQWSRKKTKDNVGDGSFLVFFNAQIVKWKARNGRVISDNICKSKNIYKASSTVRRSMMFEWNINNVSKKGVWTSLSDAIWQRSIKRYNLRKPHCSPFKKPTFLDIHFLKNSGRHCGPQAYKNCDLFWIMHSTTYVVIQKWKAPIALFFHL